jgi:hypothetical protein
LAPVPYCFDSESFPFTQIFQLAALIGDWTAGCAQGINEFIDPDRSSITRTIEGDNKDGRRLCRYQALGAAGDSL